MDKTPQPLPDTKNLFLPLDFCPAIGYTYDMNTSLSIFARALATENLSFSFDSQAQTASFDVKNRHLVMPVWNVSETVQTMLVAHEISHALWTPYGRSEELLTAAEKEGYIPEVLQRIANIVEDVRIEKLMKDKYPGTRRDFFLGYKEINDRDMFGFKQADLTKTNLLNRLNIHFKWGVPGFIDLPLSAGEQVIVDAIDAVETFDDVFKVAKSLYNHPEVQEMVKKYQEQKAQVNGGSPDEQAKQALDKMLPDMDGIGKKDGEEYTHNVLTITGVENVSDFIIPTAALRDDFAKMNVSPNLTSYREFVRESDAFVRQLVAQFERRKAADEIRRERPKQTGNLNLDKLHQYRTHDDIFLSKIIKQDGKNHGIVFMLDFSGSMSTSVKNCFLQILQLVWFCERAKIPFEVFTYTEQHYHNLNKHGLKLPNQTKNKRTCPFSLDYDSTRLLNIASSRDSAEQREELLALLYQTLVTGEIGRPGLMYMGGTPTVEAISLASQFMVDWVKANNIQIPTLMVVTDGSPNGITCSGLEGEQRCFYGYNSRVIMMDEVLGRATVIDPAEANRHIDFPHLIIQGMLEGLKERINARCVGMFVGPRFLTERDFQGFCMSMAEQRKFWEARGGSIDLTASARFKAAKEAYEDGAIIVHPDRYPGYDCYFLVKTPKIVSDSDAVIGGDFRKVKTNFIKTMGKRSSSRVFLTRYIDIVAGQPVKGMLDKIYNHPVM